MAEGGRNAAQPSVTLVAGDAIHDAVRAHEAAAQLADRSGLSRQAKSHRELAARMRSGSLRIGEKGGPAVRTPTA